MSSKKELLIQPSSHKGSTRIGQEQTFTDQPSAESIYSGDFDIFDVDKDAIYIDNDIVGSNVRKPTKLENRINFWEHIENNKDTFFSHYNPKNIKDYSSWIVKPEYGDLAQYEIDTAGVKPDYDSGHVAHGYNVPNNDIMSFRTSEIDKNRQRFAKLAKSGKNIWLTKEQADISLIPNSEILSSINSQGTLTEIEDNGVKKSIRVGVGVTAGTRTKLKIGGRNAVDAHKALGIASDRFSTFQYLNNKGVWESMTGRHLSTTEETLEPSHFVSGTTRDNDEDQSLVNVGVHSRKTKIPSQNSGAVNNPSKYALDSDFKSVSTWSQDQLNSAYYENFHQLNVSADSYLKQWGLIKNDNNWYRKYDPTTVPTSSMSNNNKQKLKTAFDYTQSLINSGKVPSLSFAIEKAFVLEGSNYRSPVTNSTYPIKNYGDNAKSRKKLRSDIISDYASAPPPVPLPKQSSASNKIVLNLSRRFVP